MPKSKAIKLSVGDHVTLKNGRQGSVLEIAGSRFCIDYNDGSTPEWIATSNVVKVG